MPDFIPYAPEEMMPEAAATALHFARWFQNWEAGFEGRPGAVRLRIGALQRLTPGAEIRSRKDAVQTAGAETSLQCFRFGFLQVGTVRLAFEHTSGSAASLATVVRWRGGVSTTLASYVCSGAWVARAVDCPVLPGDAVAVSISAAALSTASVRNIRLQTGGEDLWPGAEAILEGNTYA